MGGGVSAATVAAVATITAAVVEEDAPVSVEPDAIIYLRAHPNTCAGRLRKRGRSEESSVSIDYLVSLDEKHEDWLAAELATTARGAARTGEACKKGTPEAEIRTFASNGHGGTRKIPVLIIDANFDFEDDATRRGEMTAAVSTWLVGLRL